MTTAQKKKKLRGQADRLWFEVCMNKSDGKCLLCQKPAMQIHHFFPKGSYGHLRYVIDNGIPLCKGCHFVLEHKDKSLQAKISYIKGRKWYEKLDKLAKNRPTSFTTVSWYENNIERLNNLLDK